MQPQQKLESPQKTYFFERADGSIFHTQESEAWHVLKGRNQTLGERRQPAKLIGVSDGRLYYEAVIKAIDLQRAGNLLGGQAILRDALAQEIERARGKIEMPRNFDTIGQGGGPVDLSRMR